MTRSPFLKIIEKLIQILFCIEGLYIFDVIEKCITIKALEVDALINICNRAKETIYNVSETTSIVICIYGENESYLSTYKIHIQFNINTIRFAILILYNKCRKENLIMKKCMITVTTVLISLSILTGCTLKENASANIATHLLASDTSTGISSTSNYQDAYDNLVLFKVDEYSLNSVAKFNDSLMPIDGNLSEILETYSTVIASLPENDKNHYFFRVSLAASLNELYCEQLGEETTYDGYVRKVDRPLVPLNEEEKQLLSEKPSYEFYFTAWYSIKYTISDSEVLTVGERDQALLTFHTKLQSYVDDLSESQLTSSNIRKNLSKKVAEIVKSLSSETLKLTCEIRNIEVHNSGVETQW